MVASELIKVLQSQIDEHGDLPVFSVDDDVEGEVQEVTVADPSQGIDIYSKLVDFPKRFLVT